MTIYIVHFMLLAVYMLLYTLGPKNRAAKMIFIFLAFGQTFLLYALRDISVGTDTWPMALSYSHPLIAESFAYLGTKAPLYNVLKSIFYVVIPAEQGYMLMCGIFIIGGTAFYIYRNSKNILLSSFLFFSLYFFFQSMNIARQFMAIVLAANAMMFILEERKYVAILLLGAAVGFHSTAIVMVPLLALLFIKSPQARRWFYVLYCVMLIFCIPLLSVFTALFPKYAFYVATGYLFEAGNNRKILLTLFYAMLTLAAGWIYGKTRLASTPQENVRWEFMLFCSVATVIIGIIALQSILLTRIEYYFSFTYLLFIPLILNKIHKKSRLMITCLTWIILAIPGLFQFVSNFGEIRPYLFFGE